MYRGDTSLPGLFTSNHDIARVINRVAGGGTTKGIQYQHNVSVSDYAKYEKSANLVKIAEILFPGLTWVYYGDEIGMTGNLEKDSDGQHVADVPYADLWYRQPMKWVSNGQKGDEAGTTDYYVTGSSMKVKQDDTNASAAVKPALEQMNDPNSDYSLLKQYIALKTGNDEVGKALRVGSIEVAPDAKPFVSGTMMANALCFIRKSGSTTIKVVVNFNKDALTAESWNLGGTVLASYGGATQNSIPGYSVLVVKE